MMDIFYVPYMKMDPTDGPIPAFRAVGKRVATHVYYMILSYAPRHVGPLALCWNITLFRLRNGLLALNVGDRNTVRRLLREGSVSSFQRHHHRLEYVQEDFWLSAEFTSFPKRGEFGITDYMVIWS